MASTDELAPIANISGFIFSADLTGREASAPEGDDREATVVVGDVLKAPDGMRALGGRTVTVHLRHRLSEGRYVLFADLVSVGTTITVRETAHLDGDRLAEAEAAVRRGYADRMRPRLEAAAVVVLGSTGDVNPVFPPSERRGRVPWALAAVDVDRVLKGPRGRRHLTVIGPSPASKRMPQAPALRSGVYAVFLLQPPPEEALEYVPERDRTTVGFISATSDIQPADRAEALARLLRSDEEE